MKDLRETALAVKAASAELGLLGTEKRNAALAAIADALMAHEADILAANELDLADGRANGMRESMLDRLALTHARVEGMAEGVRQLIALPDPVGEVVEEFARPNGLRIRKVRVPLGVIGMIYEARPNVTVDTAAIALKTGNGILLRGSASALRSNMALAGAMRGALKGAGVPENALAVVEDTAHESVDRMLRMNDCVDVIIPRGGAGLIRRVLETATVPVLETGVGNCHVYLDESAHYDMAEAIVVNAKTQRPSVCNAMETLLVHSVWATAHLAKLLAKLHMLGVTIHGDAQVRAVDKLALPAGEEDWANEYLAPAHCLPQIPTPAALRHAPVRGQSSHGTWPCRCPGPSIFAEAQWRFLPGGGSCCGCGRKADSCRRFPAQRCKRSSRLYRRR